MSGQRIIALLGRRDAPTDAVEEYCRYLGEALIAEEFDLNIEHVAWRESGWRSAASSLRDRAQGWRGAWVLVQYTALAWSARGFPLRFLQVLKILKTAGVRLGVVFHDVSLRGKANDRRGAAPRAVAGHARGAASKRRRCFYGTTAKKLLDEARSWQRIFIPVGANLPTSSDANSRQGISTGGKLSIAVYSLTGGEAGRWEIDNIVEAVRFAATRAGNLRLIVFGRNAQSAEKELTKRFSDSGVELHVLGVLPPEDVVRSLSVSDVLLFVRGPISTRRGSAIAGIACGLPVIAFEGPETAAPITEAGLAIFSPHRKGDLGDVLLRVLQDEHYRASLAQRSLVAQRQYFSWHVIAAQYAEFMRRGM